MEIIKPIESRTVVRRILIWFLINTVLGTIIAFLMAAGSPHSYRDIFISTQITTHIISTLSSTTGRITRRIFFRTGVIRQILLVLPWTFTASMAGYFISRITTRAITGIFPFPGAAGNHGLLIAAVLFITLTITSISIIIERLTKSRNELLERIGAGKTGGRNGGSLAVKEGENHFVIDFRDIIYLSSHGKKTLIHTEERDYETSLLLKEIEKRLDRESFIRIHKQFIVNRGYIVKIQYYRGGRYMVYLKDSDETMLPVGKNATGALKERLGI